MAWGVAKPKISCKSRTVIPLASRSLMMFCPVATMSMAGICLISNLPQLILPTGLLLWLQVFYNNKKPPISYKISGGLFLRLFRALARSFSP
jgi:hypothetical protein